ncbi:MAG: hypothetical protein U0800_16945 [Isosphaeraceae bacterium]
MSPSESDRRIRVFHLVWAPLGLGPFEAFLDSYRAHPAGSPHRLCILYNGFGPGADLGEYRSRLDGVEHEHLVVPEPVQDIAAYLFAARSTDGESLCFLNSYSRVTRDGWLECLSGHLALPRVGAVGATGSFESHSSVMLRYFPRPRVLSLPFLRSVYRLARGRGRLAEHPELGWIPSWREYPLFPNPHLRTNGFMIRRADMLRLKVGPLATKQDAYRFESGRRSMTRQLLARGLRPLVVGRDGLAYPIKDWPASRTFRSEDASNLLVTDNQTREYAEFDPETRRIKAQDAWGNRAPATEAAAMAESHGRA